MRFALETNPKRATTFPFVIAWLVLLLLGGVSFAVAFLGIRLWMPIIQFGIAAIQTAIVFILFMRLKGAPSLKWVLAVTGFFWLLFLYGLSMTDYADRRGWPLNVRASEQAVQIQRTGK